MFNQTMQSRNQRCNTAISVGLNSGSESQDICSVVFIVLMSMSMGM